ncbi:MAG: hypothetical protein KA280_06455 [Thermomonas sp.]|nr:hypothetical protein [Thermomonas sp.]
MPFDRLAALLFDPVLLLARRAVVAVPAVAIVAAAVVAIPPRLAVARFGDDALACARLRGLAALLVGVVFGLDGLFRLALDRLATLLGDAPAGILALADLLGDLLAAVGGARGVGIAKPGRALGLVPALLLDPLAHPSALADLFDVQRITPLLLFLLRGITPVLVAFRRGGACLRRLRGLGLALLPALFVLLLARGAEIVAVVIAATLLRAGGCDAADREQRAQQCGGQGADGGKAVHLVVSSWRDRFAPDACSWRLHG